MDIEKLIEQLNDFNENHIAVLCGSGQCACGYLCDKDDCIVVRAATALSTLQAENEKLRAELEQVKQERDAAVECINTVYSYILIKSKTEAVRTIEKWRRGPKED